MKGFKVKVSLNVPEKGKPNETKKVTFEADVLDIRYQSDEAVFLVFSDGTGFVLVSSKQCTMKKQNGKGNGKK